MKSRNFTILTLTLLALSSQAFGAAPAAAKPSAAVPAAAATTAAKPAEIEIAIPTALDSAQAVYSKTAKSVESNLDVFLKNGESCGLIGTQMVSKMKEERALAKQKISREQIEKALAEAGKGDDKKKAMAKKRVDAEISTIHEIYKQIDDNIDAIKMGLDSSNPPCAKATKAFYLVRGSADIMVKNLDSAKKALSTKKANLLLDGSAAFASSESAYDRAAEIIQNERAQAEERVESASIDLQ